MEWSWWAFALGVVAGTALAWVAAALAGVDLTAPGRHDDDREEHWR